jgi:hypothetical protein
MAASGGVYLHDHEIDVNRLDRLDRLDGVAM